MSSTHFPVEILYNILGRLPVKDIIRLRCVCKAWRDLVVDPEFISTHLNLQTESGRCLLHYKRCFLHYETDDRDGRDKEYFFVFHDGILLSIQNLKSHLDVTPNSLGWKTRSAVGFHHKTKDYKIVRIMYFHGIYRAYVEKEPPRVEVFSLVRNSWREVGTYAGCCVRDDRSTVVVNGRVHWFAKRTKDASSKFILAFDFGSENFGEITLPNYHHDGESQSHGYELEISVAVMKEYGLVESWSRQYSIVPNKRSFRCLGIVNNRDLMLDTIDKEGVFSYDLDKQEYKPLGFAEYLDDLVPFRESLVLYVEGSCLTPRKNLLVKGGTFREEEEQ
ncbi:hypothetical protein EZV62_011335 [Acer yangbiense]|uniref:F-box domain-containing protein n=1 Tax=Acer yangbiense TaxID=1000413 RepID=A0A5C7I544_9ROSI|nr:hypothetical protein EZV62_011335 [Acer yangbiense]